MTSPSNPFPPPPGGPWQPSIDAWNDAHLDRLDWHHVDLTALGTRPATSDGDHERLYNPDGWGCRKSVAIGLVLLAASVLGMLSLVGALVWGVTA